MYPNKLNVLVLLNKLDPVEHPCRTLSLHKTLTRLSAPSATGLERRSVLIFRVLPPAVPTLTLPFLTCTTLFPIRGSPAQAGAKKCSGLSSPYCVGAQSAHRLSCTDRLRLRLYTKRTECQNEYKAQERFWCRWQSSIGSRHNAFFSHKFELLLLLFTSGPVSCRCGCFSRLSFFYTQLHRASFVTGALDIELYRGFSRS